MDELNQILCLKFREHRHVHALLNRTGRMAILSVRGVWGGGEVCTERAVLIFRHFIALLLIAKLGQRTQNSIFVSILVLHLALTRMGRWSRLLCPLRCPAESRGRLAQFGGDGEDGGGRWESVSKGVSLGTRGSTGWLVFGGWVGVCMWKAPDTSRVLFESLAGGWRGRVKGFVPHLPLWHPG